MKSLLNSNFGLLLTNINVPFSQLASDSVTHWNYSTSLNCPLKIQLQLFTYREVTDTKDDEWHNYEYTRKQSVMNWFPEGKWIQIPSTVLSFCRRHKGWLLRFLNSLPCELTGLLLISVLMCFTCICKPIRNSPTLSYKADTEYNNSADVWTTILTEMLSPS